MEITVIKNSETIATLNLVGKLDGSNYQQLIAQAQQLYETGTRNLVLDMSQLLLISSAGISALHRVALLYRGEKSSDVEEGWASYRAISRDRENGVQEHVKLLNPTERVMQSLELVGFNTLFETHTDLGKALASFG